MTPEEKGEYLMKEMKGGCCQCPHDSKEAAIVCCDQIMSVLEQADEDRGRKEEFRPLTEYAYWDLVKQHIQSL